jgi:hypothetical protein
LAVPLEPSMIGIELADSDRLFVSSDDALAAALAD